MTISAPSLPCELYGHCMSQFTGLSAVLLNCSLTRDGSKSHTRRLLARVCGVMKTEGVDVEMIHMLDHQVGFGMVKDTTEIGDSADDWPMIHSKIMAANILVIGTPIWLGDKSSICTRVIERLYGYSGKLNDQGQWAYYGRVGGCIVTGNEDGIKHCAMNILYSLQHLGYVIPPQADAGWIGQAGPGPSYGDNDKAGGKVGLNNEFTQRNTSFMAWNLMHMARMLKDAGGIPAYGNQKTAWDKGERFVHPNPEYR